MAEKANSLWNPDLAPTGPEQRTWAWYHYASLWIGMIVAVPGWMLAAGLVEQGMSARPGDADRPARQSHRPRPDAADRPCRRALRHPLCGAGPRLVRDDRRAAAGADPRPGRLRLVRHPDLDRRRGAADPARHLAGRGPARRRPCPVLGIGPGQLAAFAAFWAHPALLRAQGADDDPPARDLDGAGSRS